MYDLCSSCWSRFVKYCRFGKREKSAHEANAWIARQLFLSVKRLQSYGVTGRCEAIKAGNQIERIDTHIEGGYQCDRQAIMMRDGRRVCHSHGRIANAVMFVDGGGNSDAYGEFSRTIIELAKIDDRFYVAAKSAIDGYVKWLATPPQEQR
jgi:hypothetical protein